MIDAKLGRIRAARMRSYADTLYFHRHRPPTGRRRAPPDDRLRRAIQYSEASVIKSIARGMLDTRLRGYDDGWLFEK
jgi:hypothetical protein